MIQIEQHRMWQYLESEWEIKYITAEACGVSIRARIDVGPVGQQLLYEFFGGMELVHRGWNEPSWKTMMFPHDLVEKLTVWGLLHRFDVVVRVDGASAGCHTHYRAYTLDEWGLEDAREVVQRWRELGFTLTSWQKHGTAMNGLQNQHVFTGRVL